MHFRHGRAVPFPLSSKDTGVADRSRLLGRLRRFPPPVVFVGLFLFNGFCGPSFLIFFFFFSLSIDTCCQTFQCPPVSLLISVVFFLLSPGGSNFFLPTRVTHCSSFVLFYTVKVPNLTPGISRVPGFAFPRILSFGCILLFIIAPLDRVRAVCCTMSVLLPLAGCLNFARPWPPRNWFSPPFSHTP